MDFHLRATEPTDVVVVQVTGQPHTSTGWHTHAGPSMVVLVSGEARLIEPKDARPRLHRGDLLRRRIVRAPVRYAPRRQ